MRIGATGYKVNSGWNTLMSLSLVSSAARGDAQSEARNEGSLGDVHMHI